MGAGSRTDNLSSPLQNELGHAPLVAPRPRPARPCGWPRGPAAPLPFPACGGKGGADTCSPQARLRPRCGRRLPCTPGRRARIRREPGRRSPARSVRSRKCTAHYLPRRDPALGVTCPLSGPGLGRGPRDGTCPPHWEVTRVQTCAADFTRCRFLAKGTAAGPIPYSPVPMM